MDKRLVIVAFGLLLTVSYASFSATILGSPDILTAIAAGIVPAVFCLWVISQDIANRQFMLGLFIVALCLRWVVAFLIFYGRQQAFFGGDAITYDAAGYALCRAWEGVGSPRSFWVRQYIDTSTSGWGMFYYVAAVYYLLGRNPLAVQLINAALGAAACIAVYKIAYLIYPQRRAARTAALLIALSPSMILWSSQLLKDAPMVLCLCLCALHTLKLRTRFAVKSFMLLLIFIFCLYSLRHYVSYIIFVAIAGALLFGAKNLNPVRILQGTILVIAIAAALIYFGAGRVAQTTLDLKRIQSGRAWSAKVANSGYGGEVDITDPKAAVSFLPIGILYVLFAPFPWMITNLRQLLTLPELAIWWALVPMLLRGYWFAIRRRLQESLLICVFTVSLTLVYALYQTNVGTAYRHRAQLYVFFSIFISIGLDLRRTAKMRTQPLLQRHRQGLPAPVPALKTVNAGLNG